AVRLEVARAGAGCRPGPRHRRRGQVFVVAAVDERLVLALLAGRLPRLDHAPGHGGHARRAGLARARRGLGVIGGPVRAGTSGDVTVMILELQPDHHLLYLLLADLAAP